MSEPIEITENFVPDVSSDHGILCESTVLEDADHANRHFAMAGPEGMSAEQMHIAELQAQMMWQVHLEGLNVQGSAL